MAFKLCCSCNNQPKTVGLWDTYDQNVWTVNFPVNWTILSNRTKDNLTDCNVLVIGRYKFSTPYTSQPTTSAQYTAIASWITGGGVLFVIHDYYGSPTTVPSSVVTSLNTALAGIGTQARAVATSGAAPTNSTSPIGTKPVSGTGAVMTDVTALYVAGPGFMSLGSSTLEFEARKTSSDPYVEIVSVEAFGAGFVVFLSDFSMLNTADSLTQITTMGNKVRLFLRNIGNISTN
jgi:hypothetical protein